MLGPCSSWELANYVLDAEDTQCEYIYCYDLDYVILIFEPSKHKP